MIQRIISNRYKIVKVLAEGGFGKTFLTEDTHLPSGRHCVIKQLKPVTNNPQIYKMVQDRFQREAAILEDLGNTNNRIPNLYAYFSEQDQFYLVQEYIEGKTLAAKVQTEGLLSESAVREILKSLLYVLNYVHSKQIVHRDIKPDNVILRDSDGVPVLIDFGAVRESMGTIANSQGNAISSIVIGTPGFMPAEQAAGRPLYSSDLYSLGLTMIYLLTGKMPQELHDLKTGNMIWHQYAMNVSPSFRAMLDKAIAYNPIERYATAKEMLDALQSPPGYVNPTVPSPHYTPASPTPVGNSSQPPTIIGQRGNPPQYISPAVTPSPPLNWVGGGGTFNTSISVPQEIQGWNWGAFMLAPLWCLTNQVWIGLISWIPYIGLPMQFILGAKGNAWAWRSRQWRSLEDFKAHQRAWAKAGIITYSCFAALFVLLAFIGANTSKNPRPNETTPSSSSQVSPTPTASDSQTPEPSTGKFPEVEIGILQTYTYNTGLFSIDVPQGWTRGDKITSNEVVTYWQDKANNSLALIKVDIFATNGNQTQEQLTERLKGFINNIYSSKPGFNMQPPVLLSNGIARITWSYTKKIDGVRGNLFGNTFIAQRGEKISILTEVVPQEQFYSLEQALTQINNSYKIYPSAPLR